MHCPALETDERDLPDCLLISRFCNARLYCLKSTSLLSRKNTSATRAIAAIAPRYQPSVWMPKFMTRADAMVGGERAAGDGCQVIAQASSVASTGSDLATSVKKMSPK